MFKKIIGHANKVSTTILYVSLLVVDVVDQDSFSVLKSKNAAVRIIFCTRNQM